MRMASSSRASGQSTSETVLMLPFYLFLVFGLLQLGQLATAVIIADYAASAVARQAVQEGATSPSSSDQARFESLLLVGMKSPVLNFKTDGTTLLSDITVDACATVDAFPFLGQFLTAAVHQNYSGGGDCGSGQSMGPLYFNGAAPYAFRVHGRATARMNYHPS